MLDKNKHIPFWLYSEMMDRILLVIDNFDKYTRKHCQRVGIYTGLFLKFLEDNNLWTDDFYGLDETDLKDIVYSAYVHDVGKVTVHSEAIKAARKLTETEWKEVQTHPEKGAYFFLAPGYENIRDNVLTHHEKYDGTGYPLGLAGKDISLGGRIISILDSFDAMTDKRPYATKEPLTLDEALEEISKCAGTHFDPELSALFIQMCKSPKYRNILSIKERKSRIHWLNDIFRGWMISDNRDFEMKLVKEEGKKTLVLRKSKGDN